MKELRLRLIFGNFPRPHLLRIVLYAGFVDALVILAAYALAFLARASANAIDIAPGMPTFMIFVVSLTLFLFYAFGVYHRLWSHTSGQGISVIIKAVGMSTLLLLIVDFPLRPRPVPLTVIVVGNMLALGGVIAVRYRQRLISGLAMQWRAPRAAESAAAAPRTRVLIVGAGESGQMLAMHLKRHAPREFQIVGFIDDDPKKQGLLVEETPVLGPHTEIPRIVEEFKIDLIAFSIHKISGPRFREILSYCERTKARIKITPDVFRLMQARHTTTLLRDVQPEDLIGRRTVSHHEAVDLSPVRSKIILVTGASGSIGSELSRQMTTLNPEKLILLDKDESGLHDLYTELSSQHPHLEIIQFLADISERDTLRPVFETYRPQIIFHAAAYKHVPMLERFPNQAVHVNIGGTRNLAELAVEYGVQRFVLISTDKAVNPTSVMGASKRICELIIRAMAKRGNHNTLFTAVRFGNVLGSRGSVVPTFTRQIDSGGPVTITHPEMTRYFMSIPEAANLVIHAACLTSNGDIFLLKMGEVVKIVDLAERMIRLRGMRPYDDIEIRFMGMRPGEKLHEQLYDGSSESSYPTAHPGIIRLNNDADHLDGDALFAWIDQIMVTGVSQQNALKELLWGLTPNEEFAAAEMASLSLAVK